MLSVDGVYAGYGGGTVLPGITLHAEPGSVHTVTGANGAGKTTLVHTIAGLITPTAGRIRLGGADITHVAAHHRARAGIALVPQGRRVFASLTVAEHLAIAARRPTDPTPGWDRATVLELLPQLGARLGHRGAQLSGGEQQMLAIGRALLTQPRLLLLDEPTEGLAPGLATQIRALITTLTGGGLTILLTTPQTGPDPAMAGHTTPTAATTTPAGTTRLAGHTTALGGAHNIPTPAGRSTPAATGPPGWAGLLTPPARPPPATPATPDDVPGQPGGATHNPIGETHAR